MKMNDLGTITSAGASHDALRYLISGGVDARLDG